MWFVSVIYFGSICVLLVGLYSSVLRFEEPGVEAWLKALELEIHVTWFDIKPFEAVWLHPKSGWKVSLIINCALWRDCYDPNAVIMEKSMSSKNSKWFAVGTCFSEEAYTLFNLLDDDRDGEISYDAHPATFWWHVCCLDLSPLRTSSFIAPCGWKETPELLTPSWLCMSSILAKFFMVFSNNLETCRVTMGYHGLPMEQLSSCEKIQWVLSGRRLGMKSSACATWWPAPLRKPPRSGSGSKVRRNRSRCNKCRAKGTRGTQRGFETCWNWLKLRCET